MFSSGQYINTISLFLIAFINAFFILNLDYDLRLAAFMFFAAYLGLFPGLTQVKKVKPVSKKYLYSAFALIIIIYFAVIFTALNAAGYIPAMTFIFFLVYLLMDSQTNAELSIRILMMTASPILFFEILLNEKILSAGILFVIILFLLNDIIKKGKISIPLVFYALLSGSVLIMHAPLIIFYLIFAVYSFRNNIPKLILFILLTALSFLTVIYTISGGYLPEYLSVYFEASVIFQQSIWILVLYFIALLYGAWITADMTEVYFLSALFMLVPVLVIMIINTFVYGIDGLQNNNYMDDFILVIPLLVAAVKDYSVDRFIGKIMPAEV